MISALERRWMVFVPPIMLVLALACPVGCAKGGEKAVDKRVDRGDTSDLHAKLNSASDYLAVADLDEFRPGRPKDDILKDVQWRAGSVVASDCKGKSITAIDYTLLADGAESHREEALHAIFVADKFVKFIRWLPGEMEEVDYHGTPWRRPKPTKLGNYCPWLNRAMNGEAVSVEDLKKEAKSITAPARAYRYWLDNRMAPRPARHTRCEHERLQRKIPNCGINSTPHN